MYFYFLDTWKDWLFQNCRTLVKVQRWPGLCMKTTSSSVFFTCWIYIKQGLFLKKSPNYILWTIPVDSVLFKIIHCQYHVVALCELSDGKRSTEFISSWLKSNCVTNLKYGLRKYCIDLNTRFLNNCVL